MKTLRLHAAGDLRLHDEPLPVAQPDESLIRVTAVGICGSDLHWFGEGAIGDAKLARPLVLGHEFAAITSEGARVAVDPAVPCDACEYCASQRAHLCPRTRFAGHASCDGALREWMAWPTRNLIPLPDSLSNEDGAMLEPLGVAIHAIRLAQVQPGATVGVFGCGAIGLLVAQVARARGAGRVLVSDPLPHRVRAATALGNWAQEWDRSACVNVALDCSGSNGAVQDAMQAVEIGGRAVLVGIPDDDRTTFIASVARRKELTIQLSRRMNNTYHEAIELVTRGLVDVRCIASHEFALDDAARGFGVAHRREGLKVIIKP